MKEGNISTKSSHVFYYRCPECHYLVEKEILFTTGCPICGRISPLARSSKLSADSRDEHIEIIDDTDVIWVAAELPIVDEDCITINVQGNTLQISAGSFKRIVLLHYAVEPDIERTYRNGVLEIKLKKTGGEYYGQ